MFDKAGLAKITIPMMAIGGTMDTGTPYEWGSKPSYEYTSSAKKALVTLENAEHTITTSCENMPWIRETPFYVWVCFDPVWDKARGQDLINHFAAAFLLAELKGDAEAAAALAPENVASQASSIRRPGTVQFSAEETPPVTATETITGYVNNRGVHIYYEVEGEGPPLVMVHWASGSTMDWRLFGYVDALKDDYRLILIDMRGHGKSDKPHDPAAYDAATQVSDIAAVLDELGIDETNYFGYSLGARLGWALAKYAPERLQSIIIGGHIPFVWDDSEWAANMLAAGTEGWANGLVSFAEGLGVGHPELYAAYAANDLEAVAMASKGLNSEDLAGDLPGTKMPILLLAGTNDEFYPEMELAAKELPNATMASMPELDHGQGFMLDRSGAAMITEFLAKVNADAEVLAVQLDSETAAAIEAMVEEMMAKNEIPGFALGIVKDGQIVYTKGFGVERVGSDKPVTVHSVFGTGSVGKTATATAIMQLVEEGKIDLTRR